jgi:hypothetical protein
MCSVDALTPPLNDHLRFLQGMEDLPYVRFSRSAGAEALPVTVSPQTPGSM